MKNLASFVQESLSFGIFAFGDLSTCYHTLYLATRGKTIKKRWWWFGNHIINNIEYKALFPLTFSKYSRWSHRKCSTSICSSRLQPVLMSGTSIGEIGSQPVTDDDMNKSKHKSEKNIARKAVHNAVTKMIEYWCLEINCQWSLSHNHQMVD